MASTQLLQLYEESIFLAKSLFDRGKATGSTANISFRFEDCVYISGTGTSFGTLSKEQFAKINLEGKHIGGAKPSKEFPLHLVYYKNNPKVHAVIHTHSFYSTLWSCCCTEHQGNAVPGHTPYLQMKLGNIGLIPYEAPGSQALFDAFEAAFDERLGYLLKNHGPVVGASDLRSAFYALEELEESAHIAWELRNIT